MLNEEIKALKQKIDEMEWLKKKVEDLETALADIKNKKNKEFFKCRNCQKVFESEDRLKNHITSYHSNTVKCKLCTKDFLKKAIWRFIKILSMKMLKNISVISVK